jgi:glycosyltransferase involved in cell wall biosynthesis
VRVLLVSRAALVSSYRAKLAAIAAHPGLELTVVVPPSWREPGRVQAREPGPTPGYDLVVEPIALNGSFHAHWYPHLDRRIATLRPDIVHVEEEPYNLATALATRAARRHGAGVVVFTWQNIARRYFPPFGSLERATLRRTDHLLCGSEASLATWRQKGYEGAASVIPQVGVDTSTFSPRPAGSPPRPFTVGYVGRLVADKGVDLLVRAFASACRGPDARLVLAGEGPARPDLAALATRLGIDSRVELTGWVASDEIPALMRRFDVLVLPSRTTRRWKEQFGRVLVEAMACGIAVVGTDSGEIPHVLGDAGILVPEDDAVALREALATLAREPARVADLGRRGRTRVDREYTNARVAERTITIYDDVVARRGAASSGRRRTRPRVTIVAHEVHDAGGMEAAMAQLVRRAALHYDITLVAARVDPTLEGMLTWRRVPTPPAPLALRLASFAAFAAPMIRASRPDLVHTLGAIVPNRADLATVQYCHAGAPADARTAGTGAGLTRRANAWASHRSSVGAERWCYRPARLRRFAAVSAGVGREVAAAYPGIPVSVTPNGVDFERFEPDDAVRAAVRREEGVAEGDVVALFVGGDWARKGLALTIDAVGRVARRGVPVRLWVVGDGDVDHHRHLADAAGIGSRTTFFGFRPDRERFLRAADLFTLPSRYETFCIAAFEAAAAALPLVMTSVNDVGALVRDGSGGVLVEPDVAALAAAIEMLAIDPIRRAADGAAARARAAAYTWDASAAAVLAVYRELLHTPA